MRTNQELLAEFRDQFYRIFEEIDENSLRVEIEHHILSILEERTQALTRKVTEATQEIQDSTWKEVLLDERTPEPDYSS